MDGIINVLKPPGMTSHDVVSYIRFLTKIKKVGHTGTLDPLASGVLPICIGKATKAVDFITSGDKMYRAEMKLGVTTDTGDSEGKIIETKEWQKFDTECQFKKNIEDVLNSFIGVSDQIPPMYSAIKVQGQKLYNLARKGIEVQRTPRQIEIKELKLIDCSRNDGTVLFDVTCSKGTYIRVLCEDIGKMLGCGAYMSYLIRTKCSIFNITESKTVEELKEMSESNTLSSNLLSVEKVFDTYPKYVITDSDDIKKFMNGGEIILDSTNKDKFVNNIITIYINDKFVGLAQTKIVGPHITAKVMKFFSSNTGE